MQVRTRILDAALRLLAGGGAHELTQPRVARAAGVRQSHLTYYFPTRVDLLQAVARHSIDRLAAQLAHARPGALAEGIAAGTADRRRARVMLGLVGAADRDPAIRRRMRAFVREIRGRLAHALEAAGLRADARSVAFFHAVVVGCAVLQLARGDAASRAEARDVVRFAADIVRKGRR
jgi:AcrR family transcriptional regulator